MAAHIDRSQSRGMRKRLVAVLAGLMIFALVSASAATLGGINGTSSLGAETAVVAGCDGDGVSVDFSTAFKGGKYIVTDVTIDGIAAACDGLDIDLTVTDGSGTVLANGGGEVDGTSYSLSSLTVDAGEVEGVAVVIAG